MEENVRTVRIVAFYMLIPANNKVCGINPIILALYKNLFFPQFQMVKTKGKEKVLKEIIKVIVKVKDKANPREMRLPSLLRIAEIGVKPVNVLGKKIVYMSMINLSGTKLHLVGMKLIVDLDQLVNLSIRELPQLKRQ